MKLYIFLMMIICLSSLTEATSYAPVSAPSVSVEDALRYARIYAKIHLESVDDFYVDRVWFGRIPGEKKRTWIVSFANPEKGYYFVLVSMKGETQEAPGEVYTENPFLIYTLKPKQNDNNEAN